MPEGDPVGRQLCLASSCGASCDSSLFICMEQACIVQAEWSGNHAQVQQGRANASDTASHALPQDPIAEAIEGGPDTDPLPAQGVPVWRPAALYAAALLAEVVRDYHPDALSRCTLWARSIKDAIQAAMDSPLVQQPGEHAPLCSPTSCQPCVVSWGIHRSKAAADRPQSAHHDARQCHQQQATLQVRLISHTGWASMLLQGQRRRNARCGRSGAGLTPWLLWQRRVRQPCCRVCMRSSLP